MDRTNKPLTSAIKNTAISLNYRDQTHITKYNNALGQIISTENAVGNRTTYAYDALGRQITVTDPLTNTTYTAYDGLNNIIAQWGAAYPVAYAYDTQSRMTALYTYRGTNEINNQSEILNLKSEMDCTRWLYDATTGLLTQKLYADGKGTAYTYTPQGRLATRTWARGILTSYAYDETGALVAVVYSDDTPDIAYTFNRIGQVLSANNTVSTNLFTYSADTLELLSETQNGSVLTRLTDNQGRPFGLTFGDDYEVLYGYDTFGRFSSVSSSVQSVSSVGNYSYLPGSDLVSGYTIAPLAITKIYEPHRDIVTQIRNETSAGVISQYDYTNDEVGRRITRLDSGLAFAHSQTNAFGYNPRSEVISAIMHTNAYGYVFDPIGNRLASSRNAETNTYTANNLNQYTQIDTPAVPSHEPTYDADGNMIYDGKEWHYVWNGENRLILASNAAHVVTYAYDHRGRMVWKTVSSSIAPPVKATAYIWDDYNIIRETIDNQQSQITNSYVWGLDLSGTLQGAGGVSGLLAVFKSDATFHPAYDANGNITEYIANDGSIAAHREYSAFGETTELTGVLADAFMFWWSTKPWCGITGLSEYEYRVYCPKTGRWQKKDPTGEIGGINLYLYVRNQSTYLVDVLGLSESLRDALNNLEGDSYFSGVLTVTLEIGV